MNTFVTLLLSSAERQSRIERGEVEDMEAEADTSSKLTNLDNKNAEAYVEFGTNTVDEANEITSNQEETANDMI